MEIKQYDVYWVNLDPTIGREMKKTRPCLVISPNEMNENIGTVIIAPLTTTMRNYPSRIKCTLSGKSGMIALDQIKTIDKKRLANRIGKIDNNTIRLVKLTIEVMLVK
ncbi:MAG: type II toxin-antitoxin system PemK/MazF family toxin [Sphingobacteriales bacterium]|nr:type II toxin-antitoxin system PemK/MazF family toxin [Sphingobacteriales bacterium]MBI3718296.1 type II toxin-antitoxin system PemK/MazF family toxin [Sphingobacteriales bacterium]